MSGRWPTVPMAAEVKFLSGGTPRKSEAKYWDGDIPWVSSGEMAQRRIYDTELRVTEEGAENGAKLVPANTVLVVVRGMSLAKEFRISLTRREVTFNQDLKALKPSTKIDPSFLFYYLQSQSHAIRDSATEASHGTKKLELRVLEDWPLLLPDMAVQRNIASILSAYDDLIENNRRRIQLLEQSARLLYKEWFVHLRFPGHEHVKIKDGVPERWERRNMEEIATILKGKNITKDTIEEGDVPVVAGGLKPAYYHNAANASGPVITVSASGANAGHVALYHQDIWASDCSYLSSSDNPEIWFLYFAMKARQAEIFGMQQGAAQPHVYPKHLKRLSLLNPPRTLRKLFHETVAASFLQIENLEKQIEKLSKARDLLLPKLMNGAVAV